MANVQAPRMGGTTWGRTPIALIGIDWLLKHKANSIEFSRQLVVQEHDLSRKQALISSASKGFGDLKRLLFLHDVILLMISGWLSVHFLEPHLPDWTTTLLMAFTGVFFGDAALRRLKLLENAYLELWKSGGIASISGLVSFLPETAWLDRSLVSTERIKLLNSLLEMPNAVDLVGNAERKRLESYSATAYQLRKSRAKLKLEIVRLQELLRDLKRNPKQVPGE